MSGQGIKGRQILLKIHSSINFYEGSLKKIVNENLHMMSFISQTIERRREAEQDEGMITSDTILKDKQ